MSGLSRGMVAPMRLASVGTTLEVVLDGRVVCVGGWHNFGGWHGIVGTTLEERMMRRSGDSSGTVLLLPQGNPG